MKNQLRKSQVKYVSKVEKERRDYIESLKKEIKVLNSKLGTVKEENERLKLVKIEEGESLNEQKKENAKLEIVNEIIREKHQLDKDAIKKLESSFAREFKQKEIMKRNLNKITERLAMQASDLESKENLLFVIRNCLVKAQFEIECLNDFISNLKEELKALQEEFVLLKNKNKEHILNETAFNHENKKDIEVLIGLKKEKQSQLLVLYEKLLKENEHLLKEVKRKETKVVNFFAGFSSVRTLLGNTEESLDILRREEDSFVVKMKVSRLYHQISQFLRSYPK